MNKKIGKSQRPQLQRTKKCGTFGFNECRGALIYLFSPSCPCFSHSFRRAATLAHFLSRLRALRWIDGATNEIHGKGSIIEVNRNIRLLTTASCGEISVVEYSHFAPGRTPTAVYTRYSCLLILSCLGKITQV